MVPCCDLLSLSSDRLFMDQLTKENGCKSYRTFNIILWLTQFLYLRLEEFYFPIFYEAKFGNVFFSQSLRVENVMWERNLRDPPTKRFVILAKFTSVSILSTIFATFASKQMGHNFFSYFWHFCYIFYIRYGFLAKIAIFTISDPSPKSLAQFRQNRHFRCNFHFWT